MLSHVPCLAVLTLVDIWVEACPHPLLLTTWSIVTNFHSSSFLIIYSDYYDAFVSIQRGLFNTRDRIEHARKRKTISHTFSSKAIGQFEQYVGANLHALAMQWDRIADTATESGQEYAEMDVLHWFNYVAFDIIGDLVSRLRSLLNVCIHRGNYELWATSTVYSVSATFINSLISTGLWCPLRHAI